MSVFGFHAGPGGNLTGIGDHWRTLDAAGIPVFFKSVDNYGPCFELANIAKASGVNHTIVYRVSTQGQNNGIDYDVPDYALSPVAAAGKHWTNTKAKLPPEFDKQRVWVEPINEVDRNRADWLGQFAVEIAKLANAQGYKVTLFGWSSGEPEPADWSKPGMLAYLRYCAVNPGKAAVSLHEYSYNAANIKDGYPHKIGRFTQLLQTCNANNISYPEIHVTEWGWEYQNAPEVAQAMNDIAWAHSVYKPYPNVRGAAIWYLGSGWANIANKAQKLIAPVTQFTLANPPAEQPPTNPSETWLSKYEYHFNVYNDYAPGSPDWYDVGNVHVPAYPQRWTYREWVGANPYGDGQPWNNFNPLENRIVWGAYIPQSDWSNFLNGKRSLRDNKPEPGGFGIHCFAPNGATRFRYTLPKQTVKAGKTYRIRLWFYGDWCRVVNGVKTAQGLEPDHAQVELSINGNGLDQFKPIAMLGDNMATYEWKAVADGQVDVTWGFLTRFANAPHPNGVFVKGVWFEELQSEPTPPAGYKSVVYKLAQEHTADEWSGIARLAFSEYKRTMTASTDNCIVMVKDGNAESYAVVFDPQLPSQAAAIQQLQQAGVNYQARVYRQSQQPQISVSPLNQRDPRWANVDMGGDGKTIGNWGCLLVSYNVLANYLKLTNELPPAHMTRMRNAGAMSGPYMLPAALRTAFPNDITYLGYEERGDNLNARIRTSIDKGMPVPARVDFNPATGQWEQHWVLITGYTSSDFLMADPWLGDTALLSSRYNISGNDVLEGIFYERKTTQTGIDMAKYFLPNSGNFGQIFMLKNNWGGGDERCQLQAESNTSYVTKNTQFEKRTIGTDYIDLVLDTSPGNNEYYTVTGHWLPRRMSPGNIFTRTETITFRHKSNCQPVAGKPTYTAASSIRFDKHHTTWTCPESGIALSDVAELSWLVNGKIDERYWFAAGLGLVRWEKYTGHKSWIHEFATGQSNNVRETGCFA